MHVCQGFVEDQHRTQSPDSVPSMLVLNVRARGVEWCVRCGVMGSVCDASNSACFTDRHTRLPGTHMRICIPAQKDLTNAHKDSVQDVLLP